MDKQRIEQELTLARQERENFIHQAERQIATYDGAIMALERLLQPPQEQEQSQAPE